MSDDAKPKLHEISRRVQEAKRAEEPRPGAYLQMSANYIEGFVITFIILSLGIGACLLTFFVVDFFLYVLDATFRTLPFNIVSVPFDFVRGLFLALLGGSGLFALFFIWGLPDKRRATWMDWLFRVR